MKDSKYLVVIFDAAGNEYEEVVELQDGSNSEERYRAIWPSIRDEVKDRLMPDTNKKSVTPWQDQVTGYGYLIKSYSKCE